MVPPGTETPRAGNARGLLRSAGQQGLDDAVGGFLGAPPRGAVEHRDVHVGQDVGAKLPDADVAYLREIYADDMARLARLTGVSFW